jgi:8-oxo-dGTP pyrophosphatase MutT (NUDIX family)
MILRSNETNGKLEVLLVQRKVSESDPWSGHMAFPGGRSKESDGELINTATREVREETGIDIASCELLGTLDDSLPGNRSLCVTPFVVLAHKSTIVKTDGREITDHIWIPLEFFMDKKNSSPFITKRFGADRVVTSYEYMNSYIVWGMTLRLIDDLVSKLSRSISE